MYKMRRKKGVSPVIATVLLIAMVIVIGLIIFLWVRGLTEETITKFGKKNIKLVCRDVQFQASYSSDILSISNTGTVPIYSMSIKLSGGGSFTTIDLREENKSDLIFWPKLGINQGEAYSENISRYVTADKDEITIIPVLIGKSKKVEKVHTCDEKDGFKIKI